MNKELLRELLRECDKTFKKSDIDIEDSQAWENLIP